MNDPESFEHVETTYIDRPGEGYVEVKEVFRGKNAYNATVLNTVWAKCKVEGDVIEIEINDTLAYSAGIIEGGN